MAWKTLSSWMLGLAISSTAVAGDQLANLEELPPIGAGLSEIAEPLVGGDGLTLVGYEQTVGDVSAVGCCRQPPWAHRSGLDFQPLLLRARDAEVSYASTFNGAVPEGAVGVLDPEYDFGFRLGITKALDSCSSWSLRYSGFFNEQSDTLSAAAPYSLRKLLVHPSEANAATNVPRASGEYGIDLHTLDLDYRFVVLSNATTAANLIVGGRFGHLQQELDVDYLNGGLTERVSSNVKFNGIGLRLGGDLEHYTQRGLMVYGRTHVNFLAGQSKAEYLHSSSVDPVRVQSQWDAGRMLTILDLEFGVGWQPTERCRVSAGYVFSSWLGVGSTQDWIDSVQNNRFSGGDDSLDLDGLVGRLEIIL